MRSVHSPMIPEGHTSVILDVSDADGTPNGTPNGSGDGDSGGDGSTTGVAPQQFTWAHFFRRARVHLAVTMLIFAVGLGLAVYLYVVLGQWQGLMTLPTPPPCLAST